MWRKEDCDEAFKILILMSVESIFTFGEVHWLNRMYMYISYAAHIKKKSYYLPLSMRCFPVTSWMDNPQFICNHNSWKLLNLRRRVVYLINNSVPFCYAATYERSFYKSPVKRFTASGQHRPPAESSQESELSSEVHTYSSGATNSGPASASLSAKSKRWMSHISYLLYCIWGKGISLNTTYAGCGVYHLVCLLLLAYNLAHLWYFGYCALYLMDINVFVTSRHTLCLLCHNT